MDSLSIFDPTCEKQWYTMAHCCTSLFQCMPRLDAANQFQHYLNIISYSDALANEGNLHEYPRQEKLLAQLKSLLVKPGLIATFHYGQYHLLPNAILELGLPLTILISKEIASGLLNTHGQMDGSSKDNSNNQKATFLLAEDPAVIRQVQQHLKKGRFVLFFVDGNSGTLSNQKHSSDTIIPLLEGNLRVRTGIAQTSYLCRSPIYPIIQRPDKSWQFNLPINPLVDIPRRAYVDQAMKQIYQSLNQQLLHKVEAWEAWLYLHNQLQPRRTLESIKGVSPDTMVPFLKENVAYLMRKDDLLCYPLNKDNYLNLKEYYWSCINKISTLLVD